MIAKESPLGGIRHGTVATVAIREIAGLPAFDLRVAPGTSSQAAIVEALAPLNLPATSGQAGGCSLPEGNDAHALCLAPDWWLIVGSPEVERKLAPLLSQNHHFSLVDVSGQRTTLSLEGPKAREVLAHLWDQDLREKSFPVASVSQGLMAKAPVIVWHIAQFRYRVMVRSSFALHVWKALVDAAEEWV